MTVEKSMSATDLSDNAQLLYCLLNFSSVALYMLPTVTVHNKIARPWTSVQKRSQLRRRDTLGQLNVSQPLHSKLKHAWTYTKSIPLSNIMC